MDFSVREVVVGEVRVYIVTFAREMRLAGMERLYAAYAPSP